jgi:hypothetical protein
VTLRFEGGPLDGQTLEMQLAVAGIELVLERDEQKVVYAFAHWDSSGVAVYRFVAAGPRGGTP